MSSTILGIVDKKMKAVSEGLKQELATIRTGRASPALVEHLKVDYVGVPTPLNQIAGISAPEARLLVIQPWDKSLIKAVTRFSPDRKTRFSTYATWWIKQSIERALANQSRIIRLPVHVASDLGRLMRAAKALNQSLGKEPSIEEIAEEMKVSSQDVNGLMELIRKTYSIENFVSDDSTYQLADVIKDESSEKPFFLIDNLERVVEITSWLEALSQTERRVVSYRYGLGNEEPMTLEAIGKIMGVTRERIRQIENKALLKLRRFMKKKDIVFEETV